MMPRPCAVVPHLRRYYRGDCTGRCHALVAWSLTLAATISGNCGGTLLESPRALSLRLFLLSFLILFLEVVLIRWVSTEIRVFAYIKNLPLLASFLGLGLGS